MILNNDLLDQKFIFRPLSNENPFRINPMYSSLQMSREGMTTDLKVFPQTTTEGRIFSDFMTNSNSGHSRGRSYNDQISLVKRKIKVINSNKHHMRDKIARILSAERVPWESPRTLYKNKTTTNKK